MRQLSATQETNLLDTALMAYQDGAMERNEKLAGEKAPPAQCVISPPNANIVTLAHSSPPISRKKDLHLESYELPLYRIEHIVVI